MFNDLYRFFYWNIYLPNIFDIIHQLYELYYFMQFLCYINHFINSLKLNTKKVWKNMLLKSFFLNIGLNFTFYQCWNLLDHNDPILLSRVGFSASLSTLMLFMCFYLNFVVYWSGRIQPKIILLTFLSSSFTFQSELLAYCCLTNFLGHLILFYGIGL